MKSARGESVSSEAMKNKWEPEFCIERRKDLFNIVSMISGHSFKLAGGGRTLRLSEKERSEFDLPAHKKYSRGAAEVIELIVKESDKPIDDQFQENYLEILYHIGNKLRPKTKQTHFLSWLPWVSRLFESSPLFRVLLFGRRDETTRELYENVLRRVNLMEMKSLQTHRYVSSTFAITESIAAGSSSALLLPTLSSSPVIVIEERNDPNDVESVTLKTTLSSSNDANDPVVESAQPGEEKSVNLKV